MKSFDRLQQEAQQQNLVLPVEIIEAANDPAILGRYCFTATDMLAAVAAAGHMLRRNPTERILDKPFNSIEDDDIVSNTLKGILSAGHESTDPSAMPSFIYDEKVPTQSACDQSDGRFAFVLGIMKRSPWAVQGQIITAEGEPLFFRKGSPGHPTTINLREFELNGAVMPPGTILRVDTAYDAPPYEISEEDRKTRDLPPPEMPDYPIPSGLHTLDIKDITAIGFARLSSFALPPKDRTVEMMTGVEQTERFDPSIGDIFRNATMEDVNEIVREVLPSATPAS